MHTTATNSSLPRLTHELRPISRCTMMDTPMVRSQASRQVDHEASVARMRRDGHGERHSVAPTKSLSLPREHVTSAPGSCPAVSSGGRPAMHGTVQPSPIGASACMSVSSHRLVRLVRRLVRLVRRNEGEATQVRPRVPPV